MRGNYFHLFIISIVILTAMGMWTGGESWAQETPTETPVETPTETPGETPTPTPELEPTNTPTESPVEAPTSTPTESPAEQPTSTPTETPAEEPTNTPTESPAEQPTSTPTETPAEQPTSTPTESPVELPTATPTESPVDEAELTFVSPASVSQGDTVTIEINAANLSNAVAFGFVVEQSNNILTFSEVDVSGTLVEEFIEVNANVLSDPAGAVRVGFVGGPSSISEDGVLVKLVYTASAAGSTSLSLTDIVDDIEGVVTEASGDIVVEPVVEDTPTPEATSTPTESPVEEPTSTPTESPVEIPTSTPTESPEDTPIPEPTSTPVIVPTSTPTVTLTVTPTNTPRIPTPVKVNTPTPTPTAFTVNPILGLVSLDKLGGTYPRGNAVHNFDIGISDSSGNLVIPGLFDGFPDPVALGPFLFLDGVPHPIAKDIEFTGETLPVDQGGNGSEGAYFLIGGNIGSLPPVHTRLGATGGPNRGGIDLNNDPSDNINFGGFSGDIVPVLSFGPNDFESPLIDIEPAGNGGFYVLTDEGRIVSEGSALESLDTGSSVVQTDIAATNAKAVSFKIWRGEDVDPSNSQYSSELIGLGAYVLDSQGFIHTVGDGLPALNTAEVPVVPQENGVGAFQDLEFMPNADGTRFIGLAVLRGDGIVYYVPFEDEPVTPEIETHVNQLSPFNNLASGFPFDIARDLEVEISAGTIYGIDDSGNTVPVGTTTRRIGTFMFDGFGGVHTGGASTRYAAAFSPDGQYKIPSGDGTAGAFPFPITPPYFGADVVQDAELTWSVQR